MSDRHTKKSPAAQVRVGFWESPAREKQTTEDKTGQMYLLTCPYRHPSGLFELNSRTAAAHIGWDKSQLETVLKRLQEQKEIVIEDVWILLTSWWDHNNPPGPGLDLAIRQQLAAAPSNLAELWISNAREHGLPVERWISIPSTKGGSTPPTTPSSTGESPPLKQSKAVNRVKSSRAAAAFVDLEGVFVEVLNPGDEQALSALRELHGDAVVADAARKAIACGRRPLPSELRKHINTCVVMDSPPIELPLGCWTSDSGAQIKIFGTGPIEVLCAGETRPRYVQRDVFSRDLTEGRVQLRPTLIEEDAQHA